jgi:hypothetical protein
MPKNCTLAPDGSLIVNEPNGKDAQNQDKVTAWSIAPWQLERHRAMFDADMDAPTKAAVDAKIGDVKKGKA